MDSDIIWKQKSFGWGMGFPERLVSLRKQRGLTQQTLADSVNIHVTQLRRYEAGTSQPTLDVLRQLAIALRVTSDMLVFDHDERGPDDELKLQFEAISQMSAKEKDVVLDVLEGLLLKHQAHRLAELTGSR